MQSRVIYDIPFSCGETKRKLQTQLKEHMQKEEMEKSAVTEHDQP